MLILGVFLVGVVAGLRSMMAPAGVSVAAWMGVLAVAGTRLAFMGYRWVPLIWCVLVVGELIADKLPNTPSRKRLPGLVGRICTGALAGATIGAAHNALVLCLILGVAGALVGTFSGPALRARLAQAFGKDLPAALIEDACGILILLVCFARLI